MESALNAEEYEEAALIRKQLANYEVCKEHRIHTLYKPRLCEALLRSKCGAFYAVLPRMRMGSAHHEPARQRLEM